MSRFKTLSLVVILLLAALIAIVTACKKEPIPDAATSEQTPAMAPTDTIEYYANRHNIDRITLMPDTTSWQSNNNACTMWTPYHFHQARNIIQECWDYLEQHGKTVNAGNAIIYVNKYNGAQLPNNHELNGYVPYGMSLEDSVWYTDKGYRVMRGDFNYKSDDTKAQWNRKSQMDGVRPAFKNLVTPMQP